MNGELRNGLIYTTEVYRIYIVCQVSGQLSYRFHSFIRVPISHHPSHRIYRLYSTPFGHSRSCIKLVLAMALVKPTDSESESESLICLRFLR